jgi:hypothetical protein
MDKNNDLLCVVASKIEYCPKTGGMTWRAREAADFNAKTDARAKALADTWNACFAGRPAGCITREGYIQISAGNNRAVLAHRVALFIVTGEAPPQVDHINGNRADNRAENLRAACSSVNGKNRRTPRNNKSGYAGITWHRGAWQVMCGTVYIGRFKALSDAISARKSALSAAGYHPNHGISADA